MSVDAVAWALRHAPVLNAQEHVLLIALADRADEHGRNAWPWQESLAAAGRCSVRTARRHIGAMEARGLIRRGDQRLVSHIRKDRRPIVWDLDLSQRIKAGAPVVTEESIGAREDNLTGRSEVDISDTSERPDNMTGRTNGVSDARDDRPDNLSARTQLWSNDRTELCPTVRTERPSSSGYVGGDSPVDRAVASSENPPTNPEQEQDGPRLPTCARHPEGSTEPCAGCAEARRARKAWEEWQARQAKERRSAEVRAIADAKALAIDECSMCDSDGYVGMTLCDHDPGSVERGRRGLAAARIAACRHCDADGFRVDGSVCDHRVSHASDTAPPDLRSVEAPARSAADEAAASIDPLSA